MKTQKLLKLYIDMLNNPETTEEDQLRETRYLLYKNIHLLTEKEKGLLKDSEIDIEASSYEGYDQYDEYPKAIYNTWNEF